MNCPYCSHENIEGMDDCEECGQPLSDLHLPTPATVVERSLLKEKISAIELREHLIIAPDTRIQEVLERLVEKEVGCAIVVENDQVVGIFSERDALMKLNVDFAELGSCPVSQFMTASPQTLAASTKIAFAVRQMDQGGFRHIPIVDEDGKLAGVISVRDILRYLTEKMTSAELV